MTKSWDKGTSNKLHQYWYYGYCIKETGQTWISQPV